MSRVRLTINLDLHMPGLPSQEALNAAMQRAEHAAARVFLYGDAGGKINVTIEPSDNAVEKSCDVLDLRTGHVSATIGRAPAKKRAAPVAADATGQAMARALDRPAPPKKRGRR